jgi:nicotinic acid phosphoribosyltransferase
MQSLRLNPILNTDSYKLTHWWQYPPDTRHIYSYVESRGGMFDETMLAMLQYIIKSNFAGQVFTTVEVVDAASIPSNNALETIFEDGQLLRDQILAEVRGIASSYGTYNETV